MHVYIASCIHMYVVSIVPESLRWLAVKGRLEEARSVLNKMATFNKKPMPDTSILELIAMEEKAEGEKSKSYTYKHLFLTRSLTKRTVITWYIWYVYRLKLRAICRLSIQMTRRHSSPVWPGPELHVSITWHNTTWRWSLHNNTTLFLFVYVFDFVSRRMPKNLYNTEYPS